MRSPAATVAALLLATMPLLAACRTPLARPGGSTPDPASAAIGPGAPAAPGARAIFFQGLSDVETPLARLRANPTLSGPPVLVQFPDVERAVAERFAGGTSNGRVREPMVVGFSAVSPLPPRQMTILLTDPEAERASFRADTFRPVRAMYDTPDASRRLFVVEMLRVGQGPARFDFRFAFALERLRLADGTVLLRYDPVHWEQTEHVTLFRGVAMIEPHGTGSIVTEFMVFGSDVSLPFFLRGKMRESAVKNFRDRAARLWSLAGA